MNEAVPHTLREWETFYVIVGSSAGALTGLQFVVLTLIAELGRNRTRGESISIFGTPNVVHFCAALLVSAILSAPWHGLGPPGGALVICGVAGILYSAITLRRALRQREYRPVLEDWVWHAVLPTLAYGAMLYGGVMLPRTSADTLFMIGGATLLLVFIGIHNAWDTVLYITVEWGFRGGESKPAPLAPAPPTPTPEITANAGSGEAPSPPPA